MDADIGFCRYVYAAIGAQVYNRTGNQKIAAAEQAAALLIDIRYSGRIKYKIWLIAITSLCLPCYNIKVTGGDVLERGGKQAA